MANEGRKHRLQIVNGLRCPGSNPKNILEVMNYKPTSDDIFIVTYPKCGTTWMQNIVLYIFRKGVELEDYKDFKRMCPFLDTNGIQAAADMPRPGAFKTHLPYNFMPYSPDAKYIFVARNPKDCCVSLYYHMKGGKGSQFSKETFADFFEDFMAGEVESNDYFDHLMSWYPHRNDENVFYTTYEDMKEDIKSVVLRLATFLGKEYIDAIEKDSNILDNIVRLSGFDHMKSKLLAPSDSTPTSNKGDDNLDTDVDMPPKHRKGGFWFRNTHFRKGIIGDWKNHFTEEQSERLNKKFEERLKGTEIYEKYKPYM